MKIVRMKANPSGSYPGPQDWSGAEIPEGYAAVPENMDLSGFYAAKGFILPSFEDGVMTGYEVNQAALNVWNTEHPEPDPVETAQAAKLAELSAACNAAIVAGIDLEFNGETVHFNLSIEDQSNIANLFRVVELGGTEFPYQADGGVCRIYSATEIAQIYIAAQMLITTQTTYHNTLKAYVQTLTTAEGLEAIAYGMDLPDEYAAQMAEKLAVAQAQMEAIVAKLGG